MIDRKKFAQYAEDKWKTIKYSEYDCQGFVELCARLAGWRFNSAGSNDMWRHYLKKKGKTITFQPIIGDIVFRWRKESNALPAKYHGDGIGDMFHVGILTKAEPNEYVVCHSSGLKTNGRRDTFKSLAVLAARWQYAGTLKNTADLLEEHTNTNIEAKPQATTTYTNVEKDIWDFFKFKGLNNHAVAGIMGNLYAESSLRSNNLQNSKEIKLGYSDSEYTKAVDNGVYNNFVKDSAGYGLAQWTYWSRKEKLLQYAKSVNTSISDLKMQLEFLWDEMQDYKTMMNVLKNSTSIYVASTSFLTQFEKPANQSDAVKTQRANFGKKYFEKFVETSSEGLSQTNKPILQAPILIEIINNKLNYRIGPGYNFKSKGFVPNGWYTVTKIKDIWGYVPELLDGWIVLNNPAWIRIVQESERQKVKVTGSGLRIRSGPGTNFDILGHVIKGNVYELLDISNNGNWGKIADGWICLDYTKKV